MKIRALVLAVLGGVALSIWLLWPDKDAAEPTRGREATSAELSVKASESGEAIQVGRLIDTSMFAESYGSDGTTVQDDLEGVNDLLNDSQLMFKDFPSYFLPDNRALTEFLRGKNKEGLAWIRPGHPAVSPEGELLDRYGTPLFFHRESATRFQVRSAGLDRVMWTDDDLVFPK